ncbi:hypothetical protein [Methylobacterium sp. GC_Met_2]|uniref:hypothetical protein n=1 Tax=Methylobacterium sp. GC_Met_2 TaxID=2937376 RepID=UPI00226B10CA|nr:hypothetical protein [Methylobacterium sp. GC_Met_2]
MPNDLTVPLIMASMFTAGCYLIQRLERYAASVEHSLSMALVCLTIFTFVALIGRYAEEVHPHPQVAALSPSSP